MAIWKCSSCGTTKESRCKPKKCPKCNLENTMLKQETGEKETGASTSKRSCKRKK